MDEQQLADRFEDAAYHCEHHNPDLNSVGKFALSELPRKEGFKVVLTGEGADEIFAGYPLYMPDFLMEPDHTWPHCSIPPADRVRLYENAKTQNREAYTRIGADGSPIGVSPQLYMTQTPACMAAFERPASIFTPWAVNLQQTSVLQTIENNVPEHVKRLMDVSWHPLHSGLYVWCKGHLANILLSCLGDRTEMAHSVEARPPFLDHHLTEYVNGLPPSMKLRWDKKTDKFTEKWILREAGKPFVTQEIYERTKHPYTAPTTWPAGGPLHRLFERLLTRENVEALGFIEWDPVRELVSRAFQERDVAAMRTVMVVGQWVVLSKRFGITKVVEP